jgi:hypothetical protein
MSHGLVASLWSNNEHQYFWHLMNLNYAPHAYIRTLNILT